MPSAGTPTCTRHDLRLPCRLVVSCTLAEVAYLGGMALLWRANWVATLWVLVLPFVISSFALMIGNW